MAAVLASNEERRENVLTSNEERGEKREGW
jgi:hypothetical protein